MEANLDPIGRHPWADASGTITPRSAGVAVANMILNAGGQATTAFQCALVIAQDMERRAESRNTKKP